MSVRPAALLCVALAGAPAPAQALFSDRPLLPDWLRGWRADIDVRAEAVEWRGLEFTDVRLPVSVGDGRLEIAGARAELGGGRLHAALMHEALGRTRLTLAVRDVVLGRLAALAPHLGGVPVEADLELHGSGRSVKAIAAAADGRLTLTNTAPGRVVRGVERAGQTVFGHLLGAFNPLRGESDVTDLECLAAELDLHDGRSVSKNGLAMRTRRLRITGSGTLDLASERVALAFTPQARHGVDLEGLNLVERVLVEGSLGAPQVRVDGGNLLTRAAGLGASVARIGGSAVSAALGRSAAAGSLCLP